MGRDLTPAAKAAWERIEKLDTPDQTAILKRLVRKVAKAANEASPSTGKKMDGVISSAVKASSSVKTAPDGFSIFKAADGKRAVLFKKTQEDGTTLAYQLCEGARSVSYGDLAQYGRKGLGGAELRLHSEFRVMVGELFEAVKGLEVKNKRLKTDNKGLKLAYKIVEEGVHTKDSSAYAVFDTELTETGRIVSGLRFSANDWYAHSLRCLCGFFEVTEQKLP
jgi:hypothetical protein